MIKVQKKRKRKRKKGPNNVELFFVLQSMTRMEKVLKRLRSKRERCSVKFGSGLLNLLPFCPAPKCQNTERAEYDLQQKARDLVAEDFLSYGMGSK